MQILIRMNVIYDVDAEAEHGEKTDKFFKKLTLEPNTLRTLLLLKYP